MTLGQPAGGSAGTIHAPSSKELTGSGRWRRPHGCGGLQAPRDGRCAGSAGQWGRGCSSLPCTQEAPLQLDLAPASGTGPCGLRSTDALGVTLRFWWAWPCRVFSRKPESAPRPLPAKEQAAPGCQRLLIPRLLPVNTLVPRLPSAASWALAMTRSARAGGRATSWGWRGGLRSFGQAAVFCFLQFLMFTWFSRSFQGFFFGGAGVAKRGSLSPTGSARVAPRWSVLTRAPPAQSVHSSGSCGQRRANALPSSLRSSLPARGAPGVPGGRSLWTVARGQRIGVGEPSAFSSLVPTSP